KPCLRTGDFVKIPFSSRPDHPGVAHDRVAHTRIPIMDDAGQRPPGTIGALWAATEITIGAEPKQLELWPTAKPTSHASASGAGREELCAAPYYDTGPTPA